MKVFKDFAKDPCQENQLHPSCRVCVSAKVKEYRNRPGNREKLKKRAIAYYYKNADKIAKRRKILYYKNHTYKKLWQRCHKVGITIEQYNMIFADHNGCCDICGINQKDTRKTFSIDHDHETGAIRGLICNNCNLLIGHAFNNLDILIAAYSYLNKIAEKRRVS